MRSLEEFDHYAALELPHDASFEEVNKAYEILRDAYSPDSLALYSVFTKGDAAMMRERIEDAYRVLSNSDLRREYDSAESDGGRGRSPNPEDTQAADNRPGLSPLGSSPSLDSGIDEPVDGNWDGAALRRARLYSGMELEEIADITKVGIRTLRQIEEDAFEDLPATVYVRGFVTTYARTIGIDPTRVVAAYIARLEESRSDQARSRFLGRG
ncbi:MAG: helix-turn-helix domain-containing protein [Myxococcota bacterium]|nr:helix-turn-helix domain-containing protein [Myxococcota bacterium]